MEDVLKIELFRYKTLVFGSVLYQNDEIVERGKTNFTASNGFMIKSQGRPEIGSSLNNIYIKGESSERDNIVFRKNFDSEDEAKNFGIKLARAVKEFNEYFNTANKKSNIPSPVEQIL